MPYPLLFSQQSNTWCYYPNFTHESNVNSERLKNDRGAKASLNLKPADYAKFIFTAFILVPNHTPPVL